MEQENIKDFISNGKNLTLLNIKRPLLDDWVSKKVDEKTLYKHKGNLGWVLGEGDLVIDVDAQNGGEESYDRLVKDLDLDLCPTVDTPSGGFHIYLKYDSSKYRGLKKTFREYQGIDFLSRGAQCVIPGSSVNGVAYDWGVFSKGHFNQIEAPVQLLEMLNIIALVKRSNNDDDLGDFDGLIGNSDISEERVTEMLSTLDPNMPNNEWVKVGMALHHWHPKDGLKLWEDWSVGGETYIKGETAKRWRSFKPGVGVTLGSLFHMNKEIEISNEISKVEELKSMIGKCDNKELRINGYKEIRKAVINPMDKELLVRCVQDRLKELDGIKYPIAEIRKELSTFNEGGLIEKIDSPDWCRSWVYLESHDKFVDIDSLRYVSASAFNNENGQYIPLGALGSKQAATRYVADNGLVPNVSYSAYLPMTKEKIPTIGKLKVLNTFDHNSTPVEANEISRKALEAINHIKKHLKLICGDSENAKILLQWIAHQIQFPGKKITWSPLIQSVQGVGKSFIGELLKKCLGNKNVGLVSPKLAVSDFNAWATGFAVNVLEELKIAGHNRHDAANALKPLISDSTVTINPKGVSPYVTQNTTNYIVFTNYRDAIPLEDSDRRWWIIYVNLENLDEIKDHTGLDKKDYFDRLWDALRNYAPEIRKWLLDYEISDEFKSMSVAPMTIYKQMMIATERSNHDNLDEIKDLIAKGGKYFCNKAISSKDLFDMAAFEIDGFEVNSARKKNLILKQLGYSQLPKVVKIDGDVKRIWVKSPMSNEEIRQLFEK